MLVRQWASGGFACADSSCILHSIAATSLTCVAGSVYQVCWSGDSRYIASASKDSTVKVWSVRRVTSDGEAVKPIAVSTLSGHADEVYALDWAPNGEAVASGSKDRLVKM